MESSPFNTSNDADGSTSGKSKKSSGYESPVYRPAEEVAAPERPRVVPVAPAIEGIISWRDRNEDIVRGETAESSEGDADEDSESGTKKKKSSIQSYTATSTPSASPAAESLPSILPAEAAAAEAQDFGEDEDDDDDILAITDDRDFDAIDRLGYDPSRRDEAILMDEERLVDDPSLAQLPGPMKTASQHIRSQPAPASGPTAVNPNIYSQNTAGSYEAGEQFADDQPVASGGAQPPRPPIRPAEAVYSHPPDPNMSQAAYYERPAVAELYANSAPLPVMPIEHPRHTTNHDPRLGPVAATLGLGLVAEHIGRKGADRFLKNANQRTSRQLERQAEQFGANQRFMEAQQRTITAEQQRQAEQLHQIAYRQEQPAAIAPAETPAAPGGMPRPFESAPNAGPGFPAGRYEGPQAAGTSPNQQPGHYPTPAEARPPQPVQAAQEAAPEGSDEVRTELNSHEHLQSSAWHNIIVDDRGHEISGKINYGEGFRRERQQEIIPDRIGASAHGTSSVAGSSQYQQAGYAQAATPSYPGALPSGMTSPTLPQGQPTHIDTTHQLAARNESSGPTGPLLFIMVLLIFAAFFTALFV